MRGRSCKSSARRCRTGDGVDVLSLDTPRRPDAPVRLCASVAALIRLRERAGTCHHHVISRRLRLPPRPQTPAAAPMHTRAPTHPRNAAIFSSCCGGCNCGGGGGGLSAAQPEVGEGAQPPSSRAGGSAVANQGEGFTETTPLGRILPPLNGEERQLAETRALPRNGSPPSSPPPGGTTRHPRRGSSRRRPVADTVAPVPHSRDA